MKSLAHLASFSLALVVAGLGSGCASSTPTATYHQPAQDFEVVETSAQRPLTDSEKAEVRASVASYLDREGATEGGDYFLKVYLTPENVDAESEWVVVRFTRYTTQRVAVVSAYTYDYAAYSPYYSYDIYPYGYGCVSRIAFQYYVDPFYHQRYYYPRYGYGGGHKGDHGNANNHGGRPGQPGGNQGPGTRPPTVPPVANNPPPREIPNGANPTYPRQNPPAGGGRQHYEEIQKRWNGRPGVDAGPSGLVNAGNRTGADPKRENPPSVPSDDRPATATVASQPSSNQPIGNQPQTRHRNDGANSPANVNRAPRTADRAAPTGNRPQQANRPAPASSRSESSSSRPAYSVPSAPARTSAPSSSPQPARSAPPASSGGNERKQDSEGQRENLR